MPELSTLALFTAACFAIAITPGPDMLLIASRSIAQGRGAGFATYFGTATGIFIHAAAAAFGLSQLFIALPWAYDAVRYAGAAYLLYLAWKTITSTTSKAPSSAAKTSFSNLQMYNQGLLTNLLNPKIILFVLALFPQFIDPAIGSVALQIVILAILFNIIGLLVLSVVILSASKMADKMSRASSSNSRFKHLPQYLLASVFAGLATRLLLGQK